MDGQKKWKTKRKEDKKERRKERIKAYYGMISHLITLRSNCNMLSNPVTGTVVVQRGAEV
jgi:hypothetical protein